MHRDRLLRFWKKYMVCIVGRILIHLIIILVHTHKKKKFLGDKTNVVRPLTTCVELAQLLFLTSALRVLIDTRKLSQKRKPDNNRLQQLRTVMD